MQINLHYIFHVGINQQLYGWACWCWMSLLSGIVIVQCESKKSSPL